jgi:cytidylate kinase
VRPGRRVKASTIAIDGPAASGKSTVAQRLAEQLGYLYLDTGVMYRAVTLAALRRGLSPSSERVVAQLADEILIDPRPASARDGRLCDVFLDGEDVTWEIRTAAVDGAVSQVSAYPGVRQAMTARQQRIGKKGKVVMAGRDIGTVVLPDADLKIYLDASTEERARRRLSELQARGDVESYESILKALKARDHFDSTRPLAPLRAAADAHILDTTGLTVDQVVERILTLAEAPRAREE